jgi:hypothetical protein
LQTRLDTSDCPSSHRPRRSSRKDENPTGGEAEATGGLRACARAHPCSFAGATMVGNATRVRLGRRPSPRRPATRPPGKKAPRRERASPQRLCDARKRAASAESGKESLALDPLAGEPGEDAQSPDLSGNRAVCCQTEVLLASGARGSGEEREGVASQWEDRISFLCS